jgi:hypothetical protein
MRRHALRALKPLLFVVPLTIGGLWIYTYYRELIDSRRNTYIHSAAAALSNAADELGSQLAALQSAVPRADKEPEDSDPDHFKHYVDYLITTLDPDTENCKGLQDEKLEKRATLADIFLQGQQNVLRFLYVREDKKQRHCAITRPDFLPSIFNTLPDLFEDVLVVSSSGAVQYQVAGIGPRISNLESLLGSASQSQTNDEFSSVVPRLLSTSPKPDAPANPTDSVRALMQETARKNVRGAISFSNVISTQLAGERYIAIMQPVSYVRARVPITTETAGKSMDKSTFGKSDQLALVGLINEGSLAGKSAALPVEFVACSVVAMVFLYSAFFIGSSIPMKGPLQRISSLDLAVTVFCSLLCCAALTLGITHFYFVHFVRDNESKKVLEKLASNMADNVEDELCNLHHALQGMTNSSDFQDRLRASSKKTTNKAKNARVTSLLQTTQLKAVGAAYSYPFFDYVFWSDSEGGQIAKWSIRKKTTPETPMLQYPWFVEARDGRLFELRASTLQRRRLLDNRSWQGVYVEPLFSPNTAEFLTILMKKYDGANKGDKPYVGLIVAPLISLTRPVFPPGYGFSVVRRDGLVLYSSHPDRNLRENFVRECRLDNRLQAALEEGQTQNMYLRYGEQDVLAHVQPLASLDGAGWSIVTYRDLIHDEAMEADTFLQTLKFLLPHGFVMLLLASALAFGIMRKPSRKLWPDGKRAQEYSYLCGTLSLIAAFSWLMMTTGSRSLVFVEVLFLPLSAGIYAVACVLDSYRLALSVSLIYPAVGVLNGALDAHDGLSWQYNIALALLGLFIFFLTLRVLSRRKTEPAAIAGHPSKLAFIFFAAAASLLLLIVAAEPMVGYYRIAYEMVHTSAVMEDLVSVTRALEQRSFAAYEYYSDIKLPGENAGVSHRSETSESTRDDSERYRPQVSPETERFVRDSLARANDRYDNVLYSKAPHVAFAYPGKGGDGQNRPIDPDGPEWIDEEALAFSSANLHTPSYLVDEQAKPELFSSLNGDRGPDHRFHLGRTPYAQLDYRGEWLRNKIRSDFGVNVHLWNSHRLAGTVPEFELGGFLWTCVLVGVLTFVGVYLLVRLICFVGFKPPDVFPEITPEEIGMTKNNLVVLRLAGQPGQALWSIPGADSVDSRRIASTADLSSLGSYSSRPLVLDNFDLSGDSEESALSKLVMLEDLIYRGGRPIVLLASSDPVAYIAEYSSEDATRDSSSLIFFKDTKPRWDRVFLSFEHRRLTFAANFVEGSTMEQSTKELLLAQRAYASCTNSERALLYYLVKDGWINPKNKHAFSHLIARGWLKLNPMPELAPEVAFLAPHVTELAATGDIRSWHVNEAYRRTWGITLSIIFIIVIFAVLGKDVFQSVIGAVGTLLAVIPGMLGIGSQIRGRAAVTSQRGPSHVV